MTLNCTTAPFPLFSNQPCLEFCSVLRLLDAGILNL